MPFRLKRVYEAALEEDGVRVLIDRLWPRGLTKEAAGVDEWVKEVAPSQELRKWFGHDRAKWDAFVERYLRELAEAEETVARLRAMGAGGMVTLLYSTRAELHHGVVLLGVLEEK